jgi:hypothetical protein
MLQQPKEIEVEKYTESDYDDMLDDCYPKVTIGDSSWDASYVLREMDPTAYRRRFSDYQEYETKYECPICGELYDDEDDALTCCQTLYECLECYRQFDDEQAAFACCATETDDKEDKDDGGCQEGCCHWS